MPIQSVEYLEVIADLAKAKAQLDEKDRRIAELEETNTTLMRMT